MIAERLTSKQPPRFDAKAEALLIRVDEEPKQKGAPQRVVRYRGHRDRSSKNHAARSCPFRSRRSITGLERSSFEG